MRAAAATLLQFVLQCMNQTSCHQGVAVRLRKIRPVTWIVCSREQRAGTLRRPYRHREDTAVPQWREVPRIGGENLSLQHDVAGNFPARPERLLRLAIQLGLDPAGIAKRQHELILPFPLGFFAGAQ